MTIALNLALEFGTVNYEIDLVSDNCRLANSTGVII